MVDLKFSKERRNFLKYSISSFALYSAIPLASKAQCFSSPRIIIPEYSPILKGDSNALILTDLRWPHKQTLVSSSRGELLFKHQHIIEISMDDLINPPAEGLCLRTSYNNISPKVLSHWHEVKFTALQLKEIFKAIQQPNRKVVIRDSGLFGIDKIHEHDFVFSVDTLIHS